MMIVLAGMNVPEIFCPTLKAPDVTDDIVSVVPEIEPIK